MDLMLTNLIASLKRHPKSLHYKFSLNFHCRPSPIISPSSHGSVTSHHDSYHNRLKLIMGSAFRSLVLNARRSTWMSTASSAPWRRPVASPTCAARCGQARGTERWRCAHGFECTRHGFVKGTMCSRFARCLTA